MRGVVECGVVLCVGEFDGSVSDWVLILCGCV